jgi:hypothetical protein
MKKAIISPRPQTVLRTGQSYSYSSSNVSDLQSAASSELTPKTQSVIIHNAGKNRFEDEDDEYEYDCAMRKHG